MGKTSVLVVGDDIESQLEKFQSSDLALSQSWSVGRSSSSVMREVLADLQPDDLVSLVQCRV